MVFIQITGSRYLLDRVAHNLEHIQGMIHIGDHSYIPYSSFRDLSQKQKDSNLHQLVRQDMIFNNHHVQSLQKKQFTCLPESTQHSEERKKFLQELKMKHEIRTLKTKTKTNSAEYYRVTTKHTDVGNSVKDLTSSLSFGLTFIFSFFMAGLTGYYTGEYLLGLDQVSSLMLAILAIAVTITVETSLFIIKEEKKNIKKKDKAKAPDVNKMRTMNEIRKSTERPKTQ